MTRAVYFDRSAWDAVVRDTARGGNAYPRLLTAVTGAEIRLAVSHMVLDETLPLLLRPDGSGAKHLEVIVNLADWGSGVLKEPASLVAEQARAYLAGENAPSPFEPGTAQGAFLRQLPEIATREPARIEAVVAEIRQRKQSFEEELRPLRAEALSAKAGLRGRPTSLDRAVALGVPILAAGVLEAAGVGAPTGEELARLLDSCPALYAYAAVHSAYVHAQVIVGWAPHTGDSYDLLHAVAASTVDEFVSDDGFLRELVSAATRKKAAPRCLREFLATLA